MERRKKYCIIVIVASALPITHLHYLVMEQVHALKWKTGMARNISDAGEVLK